MTYGFKLFKKAAEKNEQGDPDYIKSKMCYGKQKQIFIDDDNVIANLFKEE